MELSVNIPQPERKDSTLVPQELITLFAEIAPITAALGRFLNQRSAAKSPLSLALLKHEEQKLNTTVAAVQKKLLREWEGCQHSLRALNDHWRGLSPTALSSVHALASKMSFLQKWKASLKIDSLPSTDPAAI